MNRKQAAKRRWQAVRDARARRTREHRADMRDFRFRRIKTIRTAFGTLELFKHPLLA